jgi:hypothetical protein
MEALIFLYTDTAVLYYGEILKQNKKELYHVCPWLHTYCIAGHVEEKEMK